jgi:hypothetical protein
MTRKSTLSKSRFKLALECPTKVFYSLDDMYVNTRSDDEFLQALADGGFQVGALAKAMFEAEDPAAVEVKVTGDDAQVRETAELLARENVTIFEGTIRHGNLLARVDVLRKRGQLVELIEVKAKSFDPTKPSKSFLRQDGELRSDWAAYLQDAAFQTYVFRQSYPGLEVRPFLLLVDSRVRCCVEGLGTAIRVERVADSRAEVTVDPALDVRAINPPLLAKHDVAPIVDKIIAGDVKPPTGQRSFVEFVDEMSALAARGVRAAPAPGSQCRSCEFYGDSAGLPAGKLSGWAECMEERYPGRGDSPRTQTVFALYKNSTVDPHLRKGKLLLRDLDEDDIEGDVSDDGITRPHRNRLQIKEAHEGIEARLLRKKTLRDAIASWRFPLHFIDFETSQPTLPFTAGRRPNQHLLFQFSHHVMDEDGRVEHRTQCLVAEPGVVPNVRVLRALRDALGSDQGTVIHWWDHESTILEKVVEQLLLDEEADREELAEFATQLRSTRLHDLGRLAEQAVFLAGTDGRSSIKKVLPAALRQSDHLKERYSRPVYGTAEMPSLNFPAGWLWWHAADGGVRDPYTLLEQLLSDTKLDGEARGEDEASEFVANGGAAMLAYADLQRRDVPAAERLRLEGQLLRYCELDTLAMVMVYEALREWVRVA